MESRSGAKRLQGESRSATEGPWQSSQARLRVALLLRWEDWSVVMRKGGRKGGKSFPGRRSNVCEGPEAEAPATTCWAGAARQGQPGAVTEAGTGFNLYQVSEGSHETAKSRMRSSDFSFAKTPSALSIHLFILPTDICGEATMCKDRPRAPGISQYNKDKTLQKTNPCPKELVI